MQNGTLTQNSHRQSSQSRITPPRTGPSTGPRLAGRLTTDIARPSAFPPAACITRVDISGAIRPPPIPCTARKAMRLGALQARLEATEPARKITSADIHTRLPPKRPCAHPASGIVTPRASR